MEESKQVDDSLSTSSSYSCSAVGGVCRAGNGGRPELVENMLPKFVSLDLERQEEIFRSSPWKNYFFAELYYESDFKKVINRGTAFLTDLVRVERTLEYATFLTAGHVLYGYDRVVLKHSSDLLKGKSADWAKPVVDLRAQDFRKNRKCGWYEWCYHYKDSAKLGPNDYGAIFVPKALLKDEMDRLSMSLDHLFTVQPLPIPNPYKDKPIFVAGYPVKHGRDDQECTYLALCDGKYRPRDPSQDQLIRKKETGAPVLLPAVDVHTAATLGGMSGSPVVLGDCPTDLDEPTAEWTAIAIHVGIEPVDGRDNEWTSDVPEIFRRGSGVGLAVPITQSLLEDLGLPNNQSDDEPDAGLLTAQGEDVAGSENVTEAPAQQQSALTGAANSSHKENREVQDSGGSVDAGLLSVGTRAASVNKEDEWRAEMLSDLRSRLFMDLADTSLPFSTSWKYILRCLPRVHTKAASSQGIRSLPRAYPNPQPVINNYRQNIQQQGFKNFDSECLQLTLDTWLDDMGGFATIGHLWDVLISVKLRGAADRFFCDFFSSK